MENRRVFLTSDIYEEWLKTQFLDDPFVTTSFKIIQEIQGSRRTYLKLKV